MADPTNTFVSGTGIQSSPVNTNFNESTADIQIYTGSDFDASQSGAAGTTSNNHTLSIAGGAMYRYVKIAVTVKSELNAFDSGSARTTLKIETAENGGSFTSRFNQDILFLSQGTDDPSVDDVKTIVFYYDPTAGEISNGLDVKLTGSGITSGASGGGTADITNIQTVLEYI